MRTVDVTFRGDNLGETFRDILVFCTLTGVRRGHLPNGSNFAEVSITSTSIGEANGSRHNSYKRIATI